jgi:U3 small nucleolar RNA-associated protein 14
MAVRNEQLRRRQEGSNIRDQDEEGSDVPSEEEESDDDDDDDDDQSDNGALQQSLGKLKANPFSTDQSKLGQMKFMQKAEAARALQNDEAVESLRRELAGEDSEDEVNEHATKAGRRKYGPGANVVPVAQINRNEFEEHAGSDDEEGTNGATGEDGEPAVDEPRSAKQSRTNGLSNGTRKSGPPSRTEPEAVAMNPFLAKAKKEKKAAPEPNLFPVAEATKPAVQSKSIATKPKPTPKAKAQKDQKSKPAEEPQKAKVDNFLKQRVTAADDDGWATVLGSQDDDDDEDQDEQAIEDEGIDLSDHLRNHALTAQGFAGDNVEAEFLAEKRATVAEEEATETTSYLPGWGSWTSDGMSKAEKKRNTGLKTVTKKEGIDPNKRRDKKLDKVIINQSRVKPNVKYMASQLPFPFENREQYERSLRVPKGKEWVTKKTHQDGTKPRVIVKQGIIKPLRKPLV